MPALGLLTADAVGSTTLLHRCTLEGAEGRGCVGLRVAARTTAVLSGCTVSHMHGGFGAWVVGQGSRLVAVGGSSIRQVSCMGVMVGSGAICELDDECVTSCLLNGAHVVGQGSKLLAKRSRFDRNKDANVVIKYEASAVLDGCTMSESSAACGVAVSCAGSRLTAKDCTLEGNATGDLHIYI